MRRQHIIKPSRGLPSLDLGTLWEYRELLYFLVWRDVKVRYKQTALGIMWIVLQPVVSMMIFTVLFGILLQVPSEEAPYPVFVLSALIPWNYFASSLNRSSTSLVYSSNLVTKVYFPRMLIPLSGVLSGLIDLVIASVLLLILMVAYRISPTPAAIFLPGLVLLASATALGFGLWLSALNVRYRDINYIVPFLLQIWMYATPVVYGSTLVGDRFHLLLGLNPMTGVVEGFRKALLGNVMASTHLSLPLVAVSASITAVVLISGAYFFRYTERSFADII
ncbi:MAG TPA: ABC transporter permease [Chloroflexi bacterium]|nr:ABC transporter permease [Chloroflexota bacterium]